MKSTKIILFGFYLVCHVRPAAGRADHMAPACTASGPGRQWLQCQPGARRPGLDRDNLGLEPEKQLTAWLEHCETEFKVSSHSHSNSQVPNFIWHLGRQSGGWGLGRCPQFWRSKKNSNSIQYIELYFGVSEQIKPLQPIGQAAEFKFESKFEPLPTSPSHLAITPEGYSRRQSKDFTAISMAKLLGPHSGTAWAGRSGEHKHRAFPSSKSSWPLFFLELSKILLNNGLLWGLWFSNPHPPDCQWGVLCNIVTLSNVI